MTAAILRDLARARTIATTINQPPEAPPMTDTQIFIATLKLALRIIRKAPPMTSDTPTCRKCGTEMQPGKALAQTFAEGIPDFPGEDTIRTFSAGGPGAMIDCMKCPKCGQSVTNDTPNAHPYDRRGNTDGAAEQDTPTARTSGPTLPDVESPHIPTQLRALASDPQAATCAYASDLRRAADALDAAQARIAELEVALERDRSRVADIYRRAKAAICGHIWMMEGRGPYEWDDDDFRREFGAALKGFEVAIDPLREIAKDWSNCPTKPRDIAIARAALEDRT